MEEVQFKLRIRAQPKFCLTSYVNATIIYIVPFVCVALYS